MDIFVFCFFLKGADELREHAQEFDKSAESREGDMLAYVPGCAQGVVEQHRNIKSEFQVKYNSFYGSRSALKAEQNLLM